MIYHPNSKELLYRWSMLSERLSACTSNTCEHPPFYSRPIYVVLIIMTSLSLTRTPNPSSTRENPLDVKVVHVGCNIFLLACFCFEVAKKMIQAIGSSISVRGN
jgi:hypothetical protein